MNTLKITQHPTGNTVSLNNNIIPGVIAHELKYNGNGTSTLLLAVKVGHFSITADTLGRDVDALRRKCGCGE